MKYRPNYPARFGSLVEAKAWARDFFYWYNNEHRHSSLGLMTPATVHYGRAASLTAQRQVTLTAAYEAHPERFVKGPPQPPALPRPSGLTHRSQRSRMGNRSRRGGGYVGNWAVCGYPHIHGPLASDELLTNFRKKVSQIG
jgi:putative transposase